MSDTTTRRMLAAYNQMASPTLFLSGFFQTPPINFYDSEEVEFDVTRSEEEVAIVIQDLSTGYRMNSTDLITNKSFKPPIFKEAVPLNAFDLIKRRAGEDPFQQPDFRANVIIKIFNGMRKIEDKVRRTIELQASQVLQTAEVTLIDSAGTALYTLNFNPKASHFPTVGTAWNAAGATITDDLLSSAEVNRDDGLLDSDQVIMGVNAFEAFVQNDDIQKRFDVTRIELGTIAPLEMIGSGGQFRGIVEIGTYRLDVWTYGGRFTHPQTKVSTPYIDPGKVIVRSSAGRLDATFGSIPNLGAMLNAPNAVRTLLPELLGRFSNITGGMDLFINAWMTPDGEQLFAGVGARPLMIPTAIDTFSAIDTLTGP